MTTNTMSSAKASASGTLWQQLNEAAAWNPKNVRVKKSELAMLLGMLRMLLDNGLSLQKALDSLSKDRSCKKHRKMLKKLLARVTAGESLSRAMSLFPKVFSNSMLHHVALAESSGTLIDSLERIVEHIEESVALRRKLIQKLSYPLLVILAGSGLVTFMLTTVVPQFEKIYDEAQVNLPWVTSVVTLASRTATSYIWLVPILGVVLFVLYRSVRKNESASIAFDGYLLKLPLIGPFLCDLVALEYLRSTLVLSEAGFVPLDAITQSANSVPNRSARAILTNVAKSVERGEKISSALQAAEHLFPSAVPQLIMVGEQSGGLTHACQGATQIVKKQLENRMAAVLGALEPILTVSLAICVGWIVLAIYMPMFHMFDVLDIQ